MSVRSLAFASFWLVMAGAAFSSAWGGAPTVLPGAAEPSRPLGGDVSPASGGWLVAAATVATPVPAAAQPAGGVNPPGRSQAQGLLANAVGVLERRSSLSACIRHEVYLFDQHLIGSGNYLEQRRGGQFLLRLELRTKLGDTSSSLVQVCDGQHLWIYRNLPSEKNLFQIDAVRALLALEEAEKKPRSPDANLLPGLGGLSKLLRGLDAAFDFTKVERGCWGQQKQPVWRLTGPWKREMLVRLLPAQKAAIEKGEPADLRKLPEPLPDQAVVLLGQEDLFPYRFEYRRETGGKSTDPNVSTSRALVTVDLYDVNINVAIEATQFIYNPADLQPVDQTQHYLESLGVK
jgi:hypothetical protein